VDLPVANDIDDLPKNALVLDIIISSYQFGSDAFMWSDSSLPLPIGWRPKINLSGRVIMLQHNDIIGIYHTSKAMSWKEYFMKIFVFRSFFTYRSAFSTDDIKKLLGYALLDLFEWTKQKF
jgi:hypothetical protein